MGVVSWNLEVKEWNAVVNPVKGAFSRAESPVVVGFSGVEVI